MLSKYQPLIYKNEDEKSAVREQIISEVMKYCSCTRDEVLEGIHVNNPNDNRIECTFTEITLYTEGQKLFDLTAERYGRKLWSGAAWKNKTCRKRCPFGGMCNKSLIEIDGTLYCYGQLFQKNQGKENLTEMARMQRIRIIKPDGKVCQDSFADNYDEQVLSSFLFQYELHILYFGEPYTSGGKRIRGSNVIRLLADAK